MEEKKWNAGSIGLTFAGSFLGAGYVSGQELWQFFGSFGGGGLLGVLAALALLAVFGLALMYIISRTGIAEMDAVLVPWKRLAWLRKLSSALQLILLFGVIAIMYAGGGALLEQLFSLPTWLGRTLMAVLVTLVALRGLRGAGGSLFAHRAGDRRAHADLRRHGARAVRREPSGLRRGGGEQSAHAQCGLRRGDLRFL